MQCGIAARIDSIQYLQPLLSLRGKSGRQAGQHARVRRVRRAMQGTAAGDEDCRMGCCAELEGDQACGG